MDDDEKRCIFKVVTANKRSYAYFTLNFNKNWDKIRMKIRITFLTDLWLFGHVFIFQNQVNIHKNSEFLELLQLNKNQEFFRDKILNPNHIYPIFRPFMANQVKNSQNSEFLESDLAKGWDDREWKLRNSQEIMKAIKWGEIQEVIKINFCKVVRCPLFRYLANILCQPKIVHWEKNGHIMRVFWIWSLIRENCWLWNILLRLQVRLAATQIQCHISVTTYAHF